jgi:methylthioribose-1-phosphate isomerase
MNPAFDVTPLKYVTGIITEDSILTDRNFRKFG